MCTFIKLLNSLQFQFTQLFIRQIYNEIFCNVRKLKSIVTKQNLGVLGSVFYKFSRSLQGPGNCSCQILQDLDQFLYWNQVICPERASITHGIVVFRWLKTFFFSSNSCDIPVMHVSWLLKSWCTLKFKWCGEQNVFS